MKLSIKGKEKSWKSESTETMMSDHMIRLLLFENQRVKIVKVEEITLETIVRHLNKAESVLITRKHINEETPVLNKDKEVCKPWYFTHI